MSKSSTTGETKSTSSSSSDNSGPRLSLVELAPDQLKAFAGFDAFCQDGLNFGPECTVRYFPLSHVNGGVDINDIPFSPSNPINCVVEVACGGTLHSLGNGTAGYKLYEGDQKHDLYSENVTLPISKQSPNNIPVNGGADALKTELKETGEGTDHKPKRVRQETGNIDFRIDDHTAALLEKAKKEFEAGELPKSGLRSARSLFRIDGQEAVSDLGERYGVTGVQADHGPAHNTVEDYGASAGLDNPIIQTAGTLFDNASVLKSRVAKKVSPDVPWNSTGYIYTKIEEGNKIALCVEAVKGQGGKDTLKIQSFTPDNGYPVDITNEFFQHDMSDLKVVSAKIKDEENGQNRAWYKQHQAMFKHLGDMGLVLTAVSFAIQGFPLLTYTHDKWLATFGTNCVVVRRKNDRNFKQATSFLPLRVLWVPPVNIKRRTNKMLFVAEAQDQSKMKLREIQMAVYKIDTVKAKMEEMKVRLDSALDGRETRVFGTFVGRRYQYKQPFITCLHSLNSRQTRDGWALFPSGYRGDARGDISKLRQCCTFEIDTTNKHIMLMGDFLKIDSDLDKLTIGISQYGQNAVNFISDTFIPDSKTRVKQLNEILETVEELKEAFRKGQSGKDDFQRKNDALSNKIREYMDDWEEYVDDFERAIRRLKAEWTDDENLMTLLEQKKEEVQKEEEEEEFEGVSNMSAAEEKEEEEYRALMRKPLSQRHSEAPEASQAVKNLNWGAFIKEQLPQIYYLLGREKRTRERFKKAVDEILSTSIAEGGSDDQIKQMVLHRIKELFIQSVIGDNQIFWTELKNQILATYEGDLSPEEVAREFIAKLKAELKDDNVVTQSQTAMNATFHTTAPQFWPENRHVRILTDDKTYIEGVRKGPKNQDETWMIESNDGTTHWMIEGSEIGQFQLAGGGKKTKSKKKQKRRKKRKTRRKKKRRKKKTIKRRRKRGRKTRHK